MHFLVLLLLVLPLALADVGKGRGLLNGRLRRLLPVSANVVCTSAGLKDSGGATAGCGRGGRLSKPKAIGKVTNTGSLAGCADACFAENTCGAFAFAASGACQLYSASLAQMGYAAGTSKAAFYKRSCFDANCPNILNNPGFEDGTWADWSPEAPSTATADNQVGSPGADGSNTAGNALLGAGNNQRITLGQRITNFVVGKQYVWSYDYKLGDASCGQQFGDHWVTPGGITVHDHYLTLGVANTTVGDWTSYTTYITPLTDDITITLQTTCTVSSQQVVASYDNFRLAPMENPIYTSAWPTTGGNVVRNGGFETGTLKGYTTRKYTPTSSIKIVSPGRAGSKHAAKVTLPATARVPTFLLFQTVRLDVGHTYSLSYWYKGNQTAGGPFHGMLGFMSDSPKNYYAFSEMVAYDRPDFFPLTWRHLYGTFVATAPVMDLSFEFAGTGVELMIDDIAIDKINENA